MLSNSSYNITALTVASTVINGTNVTTVVFIVDFVQNVSLPENATAVPEPPPSGVTYTFGDLRGVTPSSKCVRLSFALSASNAQGHVNILLQVHVIHYLCVSCDLLLEMKM